LDPELATEVEAMNEVAQFGKVTFDEVKGLQGVKEFLWRNVAMPLMFAGFPDPVTRMKRGVLVYGLAGTGKTWLLAALASTVACPVLRVSASTLCSRMRRYKSHDGVDDIKKLFRWASVNVFFFFNFFLFGEH
jgi:ATP-dependent 26S proteasome regulatory subunit